MSSALNFPYTSGTPGDAAALGELYCRELNMNNLLTLATVDLSGVTTELGSLSTAVVAAAATVIGSALAVGAVFFGGRALWRFFKGLAR